MNKVLTRRDFLKISSLAVTSLAFRPAFNFGELEETDQIVRVAIESISVHSQPDETSFIKFQRYRDDLINIYYEVISDKKPKYNPLWYRVWGGYIHSAHVQRVHVKLNPVPPYLSEGLYPIEITVPYTQSLFQRKDNTWTESYLLYFDTVHWVVGITTGPDGEPWYRVRDESLTYEKTLDYYIPAKHARIIPVDETTPLASEIPPEQKKIEVSLSDQELTAYQNGIVVLKTKVSTGLDYTPPGENTWKTPTGIFHVEIKMPSKHMGNSLPYNNALSDAYVLPGVSWVSFFEPKTGVAFHGTHWHQNFGMQMSHGCVNMKTEEARWLFRWITPEADMQKMSSQGYGTQVTVY
ncbi:MAG: L,D-transpeptidase [Chloroflexi bacterium]|nr:L,D-transpeptidase [Chloroflexota bacterium]